MDRQANFIMNRINKKVIFIVVARGFIIRNILRSGVLAALKSAGHKIVIFFPKRGEENEARQLIAEFSAPDVVVEFLPPHAKFKGLKQLLYWVFRRTNGYLVYTQTTWMYSRIGNARIMKRSLFWAYCEKFFYGMLARFDWLKRVARYLELNFFFKPIYEGYFEKYKPDLIFSTSIVSKEDIQFIKEAKRRRVETVSMPKGWDNITKMLYSVLPDILIVQNELMRADAAALQKMPKERIMVCGFPQFDWYRKPDIIMPRTELMKKIGLPPDRQFIFFGSEGIWAPDDHNIARFLADAVNKKGLFAKECGLFVRPHFSDVNKKRFEFLRGVSNVKVDDNFTPSRYFIDNWNPSYEETVLFTNCLFHCDVLVTTISTLVLDAVCLDKPIVGVSYDVIFRNGQDVSKSLFQQDHIRAVTKTGAVDLAYSSEELVRGINEALLMPEKRSSERAKLISDICFKVDGKSSQRVANVLLDRLR